MTQKGWEFAIENDFMAALMPTTSHIEIYMVVFSIWVPVIGRVAIWDTTI